MSIQRLHPVTDYNSVWVEPDPDGEYVTYADHVAEIERLTTILAKASLALLADRDEEWQAGVDQMREACIAAVEELHDSSEPYSETQEALWLVLINLREVRI